MNTRERILQFIEYKKLSKNKFYIETGLSNGFLDKNINVGVDKVEIICSTFPEINVEWLVMGTGEMLKDVSGTLAKPSVKKADEPTTFYVSDKELIGAKDQLIQVLENALTEARRDKEIFRTLIESKLLNHQ